jgi:hypothetical protein
MTARIDERLSHLLPALRPDHASVARITSDSAPGHLRMPLDRPAMTAAAKSKTQGGTGGHECTRIAGSQTAQMDGPRSANETSMLLPSLMNHVVKAPLPPLEMPDADSDGWVSLKGSGLSRRASGLHAA